MKYRYRVVPVKMWAYNIYTDTSPPGLVYESDAVFGTFDDAAAAAQAAVTEYEDQDENNADQASEASYRAGYSYACGQVD